MADDYVVPVAPDKSHWEPENVNAIALGYSVCNGRRSRLNMLIAAKPRELDSLGLQHVAVDGKNSYVNLVVIVG